MNYFNKINSRINTKSSKFLDIFSTLANYSSINYKIPKERLLKLIPEKFFEISEFPFSSGKMAMLSVISFQNIGFSFKYLPFLKFSYNQTNYRVYGRDKRTDEDIIWFLQTNYDKPYGLIPKYLWKIPWFKCNYTFDICFNTKHQKFTSYKISKRFENMKSIIDIKDHGEFDGNHDGFENIDHLKFILTHPIRAFYSSGNSTSTYTVWHDQLEITSGSLTNIKLDFFEKTGLLSKVELENPHSVFLAKSPFFILNLPPEKVR